MLQIEDIKKIDELKTNYTHSWFEVNNLLRLIDIFNFSSLLKDFSHFKKQGFRFQYVLSVLLSLPFAGIVNLLSEKDHIGKNYVFYRLKRNTTIDWRLILWLFVKKFTTTIKEKAVENEKIKSLVIDDRLLAKSGRSIDSTTGSELTGVAMESAIRTHDPNRMPAMANRSTRPSP